MKRAVLLGFAAMLSVAVMSGMCVFSGCESAQGLDGLTISPSSVTLTPSSNIVAFTAILNVTNSNLALPITWSLKDESLGSIVSTTPLGAVYQGNGRTGNNVITARDQYGNEGAAAISMSSSAYVITLAASPSVLSPGTNSCTVTATGGTAPYTWSVGNSSLGSISGSGSSVAYTSSAAGANSISVTDANGVSASISITQTAAASSSSSTSTPTPGG